MGNIFFYDGDCGFCNRTVMFLLDRTNSNRLNFCTLQSDYAQNILKGFGVENIDYTSAYLIKDSKLFTKSSAILYSVKLMKTNHYKIVGNMGLVIPKSIRDLVYKFIAKRRLSISSAQCKLLTSEERKRFVYEG